MKSSKYIDIPSINQVIGAIFKNPKILSQDDKYVFIEEDFPSSFHKITFSAIYNLYQLGTTNINCEVLRDYFAQRPKLKAEFEVNKGYEYLLKVKEVASLDTFNYYYNRLKKMSLLRGYESLGMDLTWLYDPDLALTNTKKLQEQEDYIDNSSLETIYNAINDKLDIVKEKYIQNVQDDGCHIGDGVLDYIESLKEATALGYPLYGDYVNTVTRGARLGKYFLRSAHTGVGKTRSMIGDACFIGCDQMYDITKNKWFDIGIQQDVLYIATEQDLQECQTMCISFLSGVDEEHILKGEYFIGEWERVVKASQILRNSHIRFECLPDFTMKMIESTIKKHIREYQTQYIFMDYIHSSASILMEVGGNGGVKNLREDNVLFLMSSKLKDIAVKYNVFVMSSTQLNGEYKTSDTPDQNLLRGSKAIADRIDWGGIMLEVTKEDLEKITPFCNKNNLPVPNVKLSIYKNRQGKYKNMYLWINADRAICRFNPIFASDWGYNIMSIENLKIKVDSSSIF